MKQKLLIIMTLAVFIFVFVIKPPDKAEALGFDTVVKLVGGKALLRGIAEKAGVRMSEKQLGNVAGYIERQTFNGDAKAIDFVKKTNGLAGVSSKPGFKKYVLDPMLWLSGLDMIIGAGQIVATMIGSGGDVQIMSPCVSPDKTLTTTITNGLNASYTPPSVASAQSWYGSGSTITTYLGQVRSTSSGKVYSYYYGENSSGSGVVIGYDNTGGWYVSYSGATALASAQNMFNTTTSANKYVAGSCPQNLQPVQGDAPDFSPVSPTIINNFSNDTYNQNTTYNLEVETPDTPNYSDTTPWNSVDSNLPNEVQPDMDAPQDITNLTEEHTDAHVDLNWSNPNDTDLAEIKVYKDGALVSSGSIISSFSDDVDKGSFHTYRITAADTHHNESQGVSISIDTKDGEPVSDAPVGSSWWKWLLSPLKAIGDFIKGIGSFLLGLFVPSDDFFNGFVSDLQTDFNAKIPVVTQLSDFFTQVKGTSTTGDAPTFKFNVPDQWGGGTYDLIDFKYFADYRLWILNIIRFTMWFAFLKKLYARIPKMIY